MRDFQLPGRSRAFASNAMAATSHPLATATALEILREGGNAVDAAVAAGVLLGFCEPAMTGLGGDMFALVKPAGSETIEALNASGKAPSGFEAQRLRLDGHDVVPVDSAWSVTLPGAVAGFAELAARHGRLGLEHCLAPAIAYAEDGIPVAPRVAKDWARAERQLAGAARRHFLVGGLPLEPGQMFRAPGQAEVLRRIAAQGPRAFYEGEVAEDMANSLSVLGGPHTVEDFASAGADWVPTIEGDYKGVTLVEHPPNGQGATALLMANILKSFDLAALDPWGAARAHIEAEAAKLAYDARDRFVADPAHMTRLDHMLAQSTADKLAALIDPARALPHVAHTAEAVHRDTVYLTVVDSDRMAVSLIYSIFQSFGSGLASEKFGILFQNRGAGFSLVQGHPNEMAPGKRPMHTIIPAMLKRGDQVVMPFGVMGGPYQAAGHARFLTNVVDFGLAPQDAIDGPRSFPVPEGLQVERGYSDDVRSDLIKLGHRVFTPEVAIGGAQAILIDPETGLLEGGSDPRKDGCALGY